MKYAVTIVIVSFFIYGVLCDFRRVCYYTNWSQYRPGKGRFTPDNIPLHLCTHIVYAFATMDGNKLKAFEWNDEDTSQKGGMFSRVNALRSQQRGLKTLIGVGGWNFGTKKMTAMLQSRHNQAQFVATSVKFLRQRNFDGLDLDFEYPAARGSPPEDKWRFSYLVKALRRAFEAEARTSGKPRLLLTAAVPAGKSNIDHGYDIPDVTQSLDFINIMTYDLHGKWESTTGHNAPLYPHPSDQGDARFLNVEFASGYWLQKGAPRHKMNVGLALYGRTFTLRDPATSGVGAPSSGGGQAGPFTREPGYLAYHEVCKFLDGGAQRHWIESQQVPYAVKGDQWVGYDDERSIGIKVNWIKKQRFGGVMIWALDLDDFSGTCGGRQYPLLSLINEGLSGRRISHVSLPTSQSKTSHTSYASRPTSHTGSSSDNYIPPYVTSGGSWPRYGSRSYGWNHHGYGDEVCGDSSKWYHPHPVYCDVFYQCSAGHLTEQRCPSGTVFSATYNVCGSSQHQPCRLLFRSHAKTFGKGYTSYFPHGNEAVDYHYTTDYKPSSDQHFDSVFKSDYTDPSYSYGSVDASAGKKEGYDVTRGADDFYVSLSTMPLYDVARDAGIPERSYHLRKASNQQSRARGESSRGSGSTYGSVGFPVFVPRRSWAPE